ncbi:hypothetical protein C8J56DRAFT_904456 [Mycena floridula]|nr:hypothetical protein C8J56DRAFT_904456 [Mycena floridula]
MAFPHIVLLQLSNPTNSQTFWDAVTFNGIVGTMIPPWRLTDSISNDSLGPILEYSRTFWTKPPQEQREFAEMNNDPWCEGRHYWKAWVDRLLLEKILPAVKLDTSQMPPAVESIILSIIFYYEHEILGTHLLDK